MLGLRGSGNKLLTLLCVCVSGESGLGKSTLINSLFLTDLYSPEYPGPSHRIKKTVQVTVHILLTAAFLFKSCSSVETAQSCLEEELELKHVFCAV